MTFLEKCIGILAILVFMLITGVAKAEDKTITAKEFASNVAEVPAKVGNWFTGEVEKTKAYQTKVWSEAKNKWPWNMLKSKKNATQD
tara:strand:+ start:271 stop:531 length:261 start_codon:yes stop_codon:yes gene_type:complete